MFCFELNILCVEMLYIDMLKVSIRSDTMRRFIDRRCYYNFKYVRNYSDFINLRHEKIQNTILKERDEQEVRDTIKIEKSLFDDSKVEKPMKTKNLYQRKKDFKFVVPTNLQKQLRIVKDADLDFEFVRLDLRHPLLISLMTSVRTRKRNDTTSQIVVEGRRLIREAIECNLKLKTLIFSSKEKVLELKEEITLAQRKMQSKIYKVPHHDLKTWSALATPPGLLAIFEKPTNAMVENMVRNNQSLPITVVCDNIRDPSNLGSIVRTCAAIPCQSIIVTKGCCDPWESKALRGGCGAHFRIPVKDGIEWKNVEGFIPADIVDECHIFIAENNLNKVQDKTKIVDYTSMERIGRHNIVIIGGESHGVSEDAYKLLESVGNRGRYLHIPLENGVNSLNVASAITLILYELKKYLKASVS